MGQGLSNRGESHASYSAMVQSGIRYLGSLEPDQKIRSDDKYGRYFLEGYYRILALRWLKRFTIRAIESIWPGGFGYSIARAKVGDAEFRAFRGRQIVNLGAGFCTRSLRLQRDPPQRLIEIDRLETLEKKRKILNKLAPSPDALEFMTMLPCDFVTQSVSEVLLTSDVYAKDEVTLFLWEGVCMYLNERAVKEMLAFVRENSARGSTIVFDYCDREYIESEGKKGGFYGGDKLFKTCKAKNEIFTFGIPQNSLQSWLGEQGYEVIKHWKRSEIEQEWLRKDDGTIVYRADGPLAIVVARTI